MHHLLELGGRTLFGDDAKVRITLLSTSEGPSESRPTALNIRRELAAIAEQAKSSDTLVVFLSGHGVSEGGVDGEYYFLTEGMIDGRLDDPEVRREHALSSTELGTALAAIRAKRQVMVLDTCHAGAVARDILSPKAIPDSEELALRRMEDAVGLYILAGSAADKVSYEATPYGHGVLTTALFEGMSGAAVAQDERTWDPLRLFRYADKRVPELALNIGGIQSPMIIVPQESKGKIAFGTASDAVRTEVRQRLPPALPFFERARFVDEAADDLYDSLEIASRLERWLQSEPPAELPFVSVGGVGLGGLKLSGRYVHEKRGWSVRLWLRDGRSVVAKSGRLPPRDDPDGLTEQIGEWLVQAAGKLRSARGSGKSTNEGGRAP
jgi:hypothetical protein